VSRMSIGLIGIVRPEKEPDLWQAVERIASIGYRGMESAQFLLEGDVAENLRRFNDTGLRALTVSMKHDHSDEDLERAIDHAKALRTDRISVWWAPCDSPEAVVDLADRLNAAGQRAAEQGIKLAYHHHAHEFTNRFDDQAAFDLLAEKTDTNAVHFVIDIAWAAIGGEDPAALLRRLADRTASIHIKDVHSLTEQGAWTTVGTGVVDLDAALTAAVESGIAWGVVEQDRLRRLDAWDTITASYLNLKELGFAD